MSKGVCENPRQAQSDVEVGELTLDFLASMSRTNRWLYDTVAPYIGNRVFEAGCGNGNITRHLLDKELVYCVDINSSHIESITMMFSGQRNLMSAVFDLCSDDLNSLATYGFDTVLCLNVLEHLRDDKRVLDGFCHLLSTKGKLITLVPTLKRLFTSLDIALGHYRRYDKISLVEMIESAGFAVENIMYLNFFGIFGWFLNGKILKRRVMDPKMLKLYDALVPFFKFFERLTGPPIGLSIILICRKV